MNPNEIAPIFKGDRAIIIGSVPVKGTERFLLLHRMKVKNKETSLTIR
jgi:hypothetical protein